VRGAQAAIDRHRALHLRQRERALLERVDDHRLVGFERRFVEAITDAQGRDLQQILLGLGVERFTVGQGLEDQLHLTDHHRLAFFDRDVQR
jgi:hypothetical protein